MTYLIQFNVMSYLIQFNMTFICRYLTGSDTLMMPDACKTCDDTEGQKPFVNAPYFVPRLYTFFTPLLVLSVAEGCGQRLLRALSAAESHGMRRSLCPQYCAQSQFLNTVPEGPL